MCGFVGCGALAACATTGAPSPAAPGPPSADAPAQQAPESPALPEAAPAAKPQPTAPKTPGELTTVLPDGTLALRRPALTALVARGAGHFNALVDVRPTFRRGRFYGWRVLSYHGPGKLDPGDVVLRINGRSVERPDQFMSVWEELTARKDLVIEVDRRSRRETWRYPIVD